MEIKAEVQAEMGYGYCPFCGAPGKMRERRPHGNDTCEDGHTYPSAASRPRPYWIFTFGFGQKHQGGFVRIFARNADDARVEMFAQYGRKWGMQYASEEEAGVEMFNLKLVSEHVARHEQK